MKYDKVALTAETVDTFRNARSLVFDHNKQLCCFSPPKSVPLCDFNYHADECVIEDFIDGTMVNLFYDNEWVLSTKTQIGATNRFYQEAPSFRDLFHETMDLNGIVYDNFDRNLCYSFVLQHPANRIVAPVETPAIFLVAV